ncbi:hypothetical protein AN1V17_15920 [Vallitalea sediminicola]
MKIIHNKKLGIISIITITFICCYLLNPYQIQSYIFGKDRITIHLKVILNGEEISLDTLSANCTFENRNCTVNSKTGTYTTKGGKHGQYSFNIIIPLERLSYKSDVILNLNYINANSWYVSESNCIVYLHTNENGNISADKAIISVKHNEKTSQNYIQNIEFVNSCLEINWGI